MRPSGAELTARPVGNNITQANALQPALISEGRVDGGRVFLAGMAPNGAALRVMRGDEAVKQVNVNGDGKWSASLDIPAARASEFIIEMDADDGRVLRSDQSLFFIKGETEEMRPLLMICVPGSAAQILQNPFGVFPGQGGFFVEAIDYDNAGGVIFSGGAPPGGINIYSGGQLIGASNVGRTGRWQLIFGNRMPLGEYEVSVEFVARSDGGMPPEPVRVTLPFSRLTPQFAAEGSPGILVQYANNRVQVGHELQGGGYQYSAIYGAGANLAAASATNSP